MFCIDKTKRALSDKTLMACPDKTYHDKYREKQPAKHVCKAVCCVLSSCLTCLLCWTLPGYRNSPKVVKRVSTVEWISRADMVELRAQLWGFDGTRCSQNDKIWVSRPWR